MMEQISQEKNSMSLEQADKLFYETHDCLSDDPDKENARIDRWIGDNNIKIK
jgi:hypothetical protein